MRPLDELPRAAALRLHGVCFDVDDTVTTRGVLDPEAYTALFSLGLCYTLQIWAQRHTPPADAALILSLESVFAVLAGWWLLNEHLAAIQIFGCISIFAAVLLSQFRQWTSVTIEQTNFPEGR